MIHSSLIELVNPGKGKWATKDGEVLRIREMEDTHLQFAMRLIARRVSKQLQRHAWDAASYAATTGGEMAADAADAEAINLFEIAGDDYRLHEACLRSVPKYHELDNELARRGLSRLSTDV
jgi:hypothetical protein